MSCLQAAGKENCLYIFW